MITKITMYYDDTCALCHTEANSLQSRNPEKITIVPVDEALTELNAAGYTRTDAMTYLCVQDDRGRWHTHMAAIRLLYRVSGSPWAYVLDLPIIKQFGNWVYPLVARNRYRVPDWLITRLYGEIPAGHCQGNNCKLPPSQR